MNSKGTRYPPTFFTQIYPLTFCGSIPWSLFPQIFRHKFWVVSRYFGMANIVLVLWQGAFSNIIDRNYLRWCKVHFLASDLASLCHILDIFPPLWLFRAALTTYFEVENYYHLSLFLRSQFFLLEREYQARPCPAETLPNLTGEVCQDYVLVAITLYLLHWSSTWAPHNLQLDQI